jgi:hypothetical protein
LSQSLQTPGQKKRVFLFWPSAILVIKGVKTKIF